jgi:hypothetical protein
MNPVGALVAASLAVLLTACASPGPTGGVVSGDDAHAAHHPDAMLTAPAIEARMVAMQAMHQKMTHAKTPAEREALMAEHAAMMQMMMNMMADRLPPVAPARSQPVRVGPISSVADAGGT